MLEELSKKTPVIYLLDDDGEAYDVVWFCSTGCRDMHPCDARQGEGWSSDWIEGTVCEHCCKPLV